MNCALAKGPNCPDVGLFLRDLQFSDIPMLNNILEIQMFANKS
jgi:hypothetical protein